MLATVLDSEHLKNKNDSSKNSSIRECGRVEIFSIN